MSWFNEGFWAVYPSPATAAQFLSLDQEYKPIDGTPPLNQIIKQEEGIYLCNDIGSLEPNKAITLEKFKEMKFDILLCSIPQHIPLFKKLIELYQPQAKLIYQIGNTWEIPNNVVRNVMASAVCAPPIQINYVQYHQEFDTSLYNYESHKGTKKIYSFINCLNVIDLYKDDWKLFLELERLLPEFEFRSFGGQTRDGAIAPQSEVARLTKEADLIFHVKQSGDGFSYGMFTAAACGRPIITRLSDYKGKLAEPLIEDGISTINVDNRSPEQVAAIIKDALGRPSTTLDLMSKMMYANFKKNVDFDLEAEKIKLFLNNLQ
jgi:hypothetical protein